MKQPKILFLVIIALLPLTLVSCAPWGTQSAGGWSGTAVHDGTVYVGTKDGRVVAINSSTENLEWSYSTAPATALTSGLACSPSAVSATIYTTPIVSGDLVYIGTYSGQVLALNMLARRQNLTFPQRGNDEWEWYCPIDNAKSNAIVADLAMSEDALYVASSNGRVYSLDKGSGDESWRREDIPVLAEKLWTSPVIQVNTLYVSTYNGHIYALSVETGELDWSFESEAGFASSPTIYRDTIFLGSFDHHLYAIKIGSDVLEWRFPEKPAGNWFWASPVVDEGIVYAGCLDGKLYAIEADTGRERWSYLTEDQNGKPSPIVSSPVLMDNLLIVVNESGTVYVFDLGAELGNDAVPLKIISIGAAVRSSFCAQEGLVYIRGEDNWAYAVDINEGEISWKLDLTNKEE
jgi:outer membrane protein assembly factor BamB